MVEGFVAAGAAGKGARADDAERHRRNRRRENRAGGGRDRLRCRDQFKAVDQRQGDAGKGDEDGRRHHQRTLGRRAVDQRARGRLGDDAGERGHRHHDADRGLVPFLFCQQVDREIGAEAVAHVGEKEIQRIQRPLDVPVS